MEHIPCFGLNFFVPTQIVSTNRQTYPNECLIVHGISGAEEKTMRIYPFFPEYLLRDNSIFVEQRILMNFIPTELRELTPHLIYGLDRMDCSRQDLHAFMRGQKNLELQMEEEWHKIRGYYYWQTMSDQQKVRILTAWNRPNELVGFFSFVSLFQQDDFADRFIGIITASTHLPTVGAFLNQMTETTNFSYMVAIQIAQCLCVCQEFLFTHNDLHPLYHVFVLFHENPTLISYTEPFVCELKTNFEIRIADYTHSSVAKPKKVKRAITENPYYNRKLDILKMQLGESNEFQENWDWYTFITMFLALLERKKDTFLQTQYFKKLKKEAIQIKNWWGKVGENAYDGRACLCEENGAYGNCIRCTVSTAELESIPTPNEFLEEIVNEFTFFQKVQQQVVVHLPEQKRAKEFQEEEPRRRKKG